MFVLGLKKKNDGEPFATLCKVKLKKKSLEKKSKFSPKYF